MKKQELRRDNVKALRLNKETIRLLEEGPALAHVGGGLSNSACAGTFGCCEKW
jgi:hypothetical protein